MGLAPLGPYQLGSVAIGYQFTIIPAGQFSGPDSNGQVAIYNYSNWLIAISSPQGNELNLQPGTGNTYDLPPGGGAVTGTIIGGSAGNSSAYVTGQVTTGPDDQIPGSWPQTLSSVALAGGNTATPVQSFLTSNVQIAAVNTPQNITSVTVPAGTWELSFDGLLVQNNAGDSCEVWITETSAGAATSALASASVYTSSGGSFSVPLTIPAVTVTVTGTTTFYAVGYANSTTYIFGYKTVLASAPNATGLVATPA